MSLRILGMGTAVPPHAMEQSEAAALLLSLLPAGGRPGAVRALYARSGIRKRHSVLLRAENGPLEERQDFYAPAAHDGDGGPSTGARMRVFEAEAPGLVVQAAAAALADSGVPPHEITHLVTVSCTGFFAPGLDAALIQRMGLPSTVQRTHVGFMGCHGALNGLRAAAAFAGADPDARVLLCSVELCSLHLGYRWEPDTLVANALFSDGAAALVGMPALTTDPDSGWRVRATGTLLFPDSADAMSWRVGDHGFHMTLSAQVPELVEKHVAGWLTGWLADQGLAPQDVGTWAVHPGGTRVLSSFANAMALERNALQVPRQVLSEYGNMSSATILFILQRLRSARAEGPVVAVAFGPGLVGEAALLE